MKMNIIVLSISTKVEFRHSLLQDNASSIVGQTTYLHVGVTGILSYVSLHFPGHCYVLRDG